MKTKEETVAELREAGFAIGEALRMVLGVYIHSGSLSDRHRRFLARTMEVVSFQAGVESIAREIEEGADD